MAETARSTFDVWSSAISDELAFWDRWFSSRGAEWPEDYRTRLDPSLPLAKYHRGFIDPLPQSDIRILDVGAGPLTLLGKTHPTKKISIVAVDALADGYDQLIAKYGVTPVIRTIAGHAESLTEQFAPNSFDMVNAQNCIDHTYDPLRAIQEMLRVVKEDCYVVLNHAENEADNEHHAGLHQWNFTIEKGHFIIRGNSTTTDVTAALANVAWVQCPDAPQNRWVQVHIKKRRSVAEGPARH